MLVIATLAGCNGSGDFKGVMVPHHLLVEDTMNEFYDEIWNDYDKVIVMSTNHFGYGFNYIQTNNEKYANDLVKYEEHKFDEDHGVTVHYDFILDRNPDAEIFPIKNQGYYAS